METNILVLGGTGAMGSHLCKILKEAGYHVYVTSRRERKDVDGISYIKGNAHDMPFLTQLLKQYQWKAIVDFMVYTTEDFQQRYQLFLDATSQYFFLSSARVYAESQQPLTEDSPRLLDVVKDEAYLATDEYALAKARQENLLMQSGKRNWTVIRPYITFDEYRLQLSSAEKEWWLYRALQGRTIIFSKDLACKYTSLTYGYDVARGIAALIGKESACGECFHITTDDKYKWSELLEAYLDAIEKETRTRPKVKMLEKWSPLVGGSPLQVKWDRLYNRKFDNSKINRFIDTSTFKGTMSALKDCVRVFIKKPYFRPISWKEEAKRDRFTREWTRLSEIPSWSQKIKYTLTRSGFLS